VHAATHSPVEALRTISQAFNRPGGCGLSRDALGSQLAEAEERSTDSKSYPVSSLISSKHGTVKSVVQRSDANTEARSETHCCKSLSRELPAEGSAKPKSPRSKLLSAHCYCF